MCQKKNSKFQAPTSRETPSVECCERASIGAWSLKFLWSLELGIWSLQHRRNPTPYSQIMYFSPTPAPDLCHFMARNAEREQEFVVSFRSASFEFRVPPLSRSFIHARGLKHFNP